jgi:peptidoglycan/xylan/chitin deacetylase (PgdA/CDA1 family)
MHFKPNSPSAILWSLLVLSACMGWSCTGHFLPSPPSRVVFQNEDFMLVTAADGDRLETLAQAYLNDKHKAWWIACANPQNALTAGQPVIIPFAPTFCGSLQPEGYQTIPVLRYEAVGPTDPKAQAVPADVFEEQMNYLAAGGRRTISLDDLHAFLNFKAVVAPGSVVITIDSSARWVYETAFPVLQKYGLRAAVFITTDRIGQPGHLTWQQLAEMARAGNDIGTCGRTDRDLTTPNPDEDPRAYLQAISNELIESARLIESTINRPVYDFAYPQGKSSDLLIALLKKHGYRLAFTRIPGENPIFIDDYKIQRSTVTASDNLPQFQNRLTTFHTAELK